MVKRKRYFVIIALFIAALTALLMQTVYSAYAASPVQAEDGVYSVNVDMSGLAMGADNFLSASSVEKNGNFYYFTFGHSPSISNLRVVNDERQVGYTVKTENGWTYYTYTLSASNLQSSIMFAAHINAMNRDVNFSVKLDLNGATRTGDYTSEGERPAEFVPVISTSAGGVYEVQQGTVFSVPAATAFIGAEECSITTTAYYLSNGVKQTVEITDSRFIVENVGEYHLVYKASSPSYKTNFGNDTFTEYDVKIISSVGGSTLVKFEDINSVLPADTAIMSSRITEGSVYETAAAEMKSIADNFEVFGVSLIDSDGNTVTLSEKIEIYLQADMSFNRTKAVIYHMDENGNLTKLDTEGYGRYVKAETDKTGTFIVCIPGVSFVMPMWGYAAICGVGAIVIVAAIPTSILIIKKRKKKSSAMN